MSTDGSALFLRDALGQVPGGGDRGGAWTASPDIAPLATPVTDPSELAASYDRQPPNTLVIGRTNFVYVRGIFTPGPGGQARVWLSHVGSELALWPQNWSGDGITIAGTPQNWIEVDAGEGQPIAVTNPPFAFQVPTPQPGTSISLIAFAESPPFHDPGQWKPTPTEAFPTTDALADYVRGDHGIAWLGTVDAAQDRPDWEVTEPVVGPADGGSFWAGFQCENMPVDGGRVAVALPGPDAQGTLSTGPIDITSPNEVGVFPITWPPNYKSAITLTYWMGATAPPPGASIQPTIMVPAAGVSEDAPPDRSQLVPVATGLRW